MDRTDPCGSRSQACIKAREEWGQGLWQHTAAQLRSTELNTYWTQIHQISSVPSNTSNTSNKDDHFWAPWDAEGISNHCETCVQKDVGICWLKHAETMQRCWLLKGKLHSNIFTAVHNLGFIHAATHATQSSELHDCYLRLQKHQEMILLGTCTALASEWTSWLHQWRWKPPPLKRRIQDYRNPQELQ